ncbi:hypothetical protein ABD87_22950 [Lysinibacillus sphaericus]|nr:hypothetical protein [Lysinibacillus sphaericus]
MKENYSKELTSAIQCRINELCRNRAITQQKLSFLSGINQSTLSDIMNGKVNPKIYTISRISTAFDMTLHEFFESPHFENLSPMTLIDKSILIMDES